MSNDGNYGQNPQGWNEWSGQSPQAQPPAGWDQTAGWAQGSQPSANQYPASPGSAGWANQPGPEGQYPGQPGYPQQPTTPGYGQQTGQQPGYQQPVTGYQAAANTGYQPQPEPPKKKSNLTPLIAGGVGLALIAAIATGALLSRRNNSAGPETSTSQTTQTPTPTVKAPGPGTYDGVMQYLKDEDFSCTDEKTEGIKSSICTHFDTAPFMIAYVGATEAGGLGRVSLEVQEEARASTSKAISDHLIKQFATTDQISDITAKIATATAPGYTKDDKTGDVRFRGNSRGSVVLWIEDWVPADLQPTVVTINDEQLGKIIGDGRYNCESNGALQTCTRTAEDITYQLVYQKAEGQTGLSRLSLRVWSPTAGIARPAFQEEAKKLFGALPDGQGDPITDWMTQQDEKAGGMEFVDGKIVDYYPRSTVSGSEAGAIYIWASCWTGTRDQC